MPKKILSVGQCNPDHNSLQNFLLKNFDCEITRIDSREEALDRLKIDKFDLVLVNRKLDIDYTDGTILVEDMKKDSKLKTTPIMILSNYKEYQEEAVALGAEYGFGKAEYSKPEVIERVAKYLTKKSNEYTHPNWLNNIKEGKNRLKKNWVETFYCKKRLAY